MQKTKITISTLLILSIAIAATQIINPASATSPLTLSSITIDPEDSTGQTTNAPGAWTTSLGDGMTQIAVYDGTTLQNIPQPSFNLGEISIPLHSGINTFTLVGNGIFPGNPYYGAVLFFNGQQTPPQIAVYNQNGGSIDYKVQPNTATVISCANGGHFFDNAPGTSWFYTADGTLIEVIDFTIDATSSSTDKVAAYNTGANGVSDMTATLSIRVTPSTSLVKATVASVWTTDISNNPKNEFSPSESVFIHWHPTPDNAVVDIKVVDTSNNVVAGPWNNLPVSNTPLSFVPPHSGYYKVLVNGQPASEIAVATVFVLPESVLGTIMTLFTGLAAFAIFAGFKTKAIRIKH
jgi:hypothetical protein